MIGGLVNNIKWLVMDYFLETSNLGSGYSAQPLFLTYRIVLLLLYYVIFI
jgi:hypothetical protein